MENLNCCCPPPPLSLKLLEEEEALVLSSSTQQKPSSALCIFSLTWTGPSQHLQDLVWFGFIVPLQYHTTYNAHTFKFTLMITLTYTLHICSHVLSVICFPFPNPNDLILI